MDRPKLEVADIFRRYGEAYRQKCGASLSTAQRRVMTAIEVCRTAVPSVAVPVLDGVDGPAAKALPRKPTSLFGGGFGGAGTVGIPVQAQFGLRISF